MTPKRGVLTMLILGLLLIGNLPAAVQGQGLHPEAGMSPFMRQRFEGIEPLPRCPAAEMESTVSPQSLRLWSNEIVDGSTTETGRHNALAFDDAGRPYIAYQGPTALQFAWHDGITWNIQVADSGTAGSWDISLALDSAGHPGIAYFDVLNGDLKYAYSDGTTWNVQVVDPGDYRGQFTALAMDASGQPHISYYDYDTYMVKYAYRDSLSWHIQDVEHVGNLGGYTSLALDAAGLPHLVYLNTFYELHYAHFDGSTWQISTVAAPATQYPSLALDGAGLPRVAFRDRSWLRYASYTGSSWQVQDVDYTADWGTYGGTTSLSLDTAGRPHIGYVDEGDRQAAYVFLDSTGWKIDYVGSVNYETDISLALRPDGLPAMSYHTFDQGLGYASILADVSAWSRTTYAWYGGGLNYEIYAARGDGAWPARLTFNSTVDYLPEFNRGCSQIAFTSYRDGNYEVYRMNADGSAQTRLTTTTFGDYHPTWSPDGTRIAYYAYPDAPSNAEIYVMNGDGSAQTRLTWNTAWDGHPTWSPDGSKIAFVSDRSADGYEIWTMNPDGSDQRQVTAGINYPAAPDWSPDGTQFALVDDFNGDGWYDLAIVNADGTGLHHPLGATPAENDYRDPAWGPHGEDVAYAQVHYIYQDGNWYWTHAYIYRLDLPSSAAFLLVDGDRNWWPDWEATDVVFPETQVWTLPQWSTGSFTVAWGGWDPGGAGLASYDIQYREGDGPWTDWLLDTAATGATFTGGQDGHTYSFRSRGRDYAANVEPYPDIPDAATTVDVSPPDSSASSSPYAAGTTFVVAWSGSDAGAGLASYDLQYRDGGGPWTDWLLETTTTSALFTGQLGHTYYFQSRARDVLGHLESYPGGDGDTHTHVPQYALSGYVLNTRAEPVAIAFVEATPPLSNTTYSRVDGSFTLYGDVSGTYALEVTRGGFGALPPLPGVAVPGGAPIFYLPPLDDAIVDGGFEAGDLAVWEVAGPVAPALTATAHTGDYGLLLGGPLPPPVVTPTAAFTASAVVTAAGGEVTSLLAVLAIPSGAVSGTAIFTLTGVPTVTGLPTGMQDVGLHLAWAAALTDGTPLTATLRPVTLTVTYSDTQWQSAQVAEEETLGLWVYDSVSLTWVPISGPPDVLSNTVAVTTTRPGLYALLGLSYAGPWTGALSQVVVLTPTLPTATLSLLYRVQGAGPVSTTLLLSLENPTATVTYTLPLTGSGWLHRWWEVPPSWGPTLTLRLAWTQPGREAGVQAVVDEISLGPTAVGVYPVYLPLVSR